MAEQVELTWWLSRELCPTEFHQEQLRDTVQRLDEADGVTARLEALIGLGEHAAEAVAVGASGSCIEFKTDPGLLGTETFLREVSKLDRVRSFGLLEQLFWTHVNLYRRTRGADIVP